MDRFVRYEVTDEGIGIPDAEQKNVFQPYTRCSNAVTMRTEAAGVGTYIAKNFIEEQGGRIGFESTEGVGSRFWIDVPIATSL